MVMISWTYESYDSHCDRSKLSKVSHYLLHIVILCCKNVLYVVYTKKRRVTVLRWSYITFTVLYLLYYAGLRAPLGHYVGLNCKLVGSNSAYVTDDTIAITIYSNLMMKLILQIVVLDSKVTQGK
jgi:hypothetical protein